MAKTGLGKGFGSLLPDNFDQSMLLDKQDRVQKILIQDITPNPDQPRQTINLEAINELAASINQYGILQPIVLTEIDGAYVIVAGERRYHAAKKAGLTHLPALVRTTKELERLEIGLIENMQRVDLSPLEQALSIARLTEQFNVSQKDIAARLGKANTTIINTVRLLQLPDFAKDALTNGVISEGHARSVLALKDAKHQQKLVTNIEQFNWSVRRAEQFVNEVKEENSPTTPEEKANKTIVNEETSKQLSTKWGFKVTVAHKGKGGKIAMNFTSRKQLEAFIEFLEKQSPR
ncbi:MAG: ParB/RepB/Spo0J family partition protein [Candidatus Saccharimonadales bacterium]